MANASQSTADFKGDHLSVTMFGAVRGYAADSSAAVQAAIDYAREEALTRIIIPGPLRLDAPIVLASGIRITGTHCPERWRSTDWDGPPAKIKYYGTGACFRIAPGASEGADSIVLENLHVDGTNAVSSGYAVTANSGTDVLTATGHTLQNGDWVLLTTSGTLPAPLTIDFPYYVRDVSGSSTFKLAKRAGAAAIDITDTGSGSHTVTRSVDGLQMDGTASGAFIEGVHLYRCSFVNFPRYQVAAFGTVFDVTLDRVTCHNKDRGAEDLINFHYPDSGGAASQVKLRDCYLLPYTDGRWAFRTNTCTDVCFVDGTVAPYATGSGAHGIWVAGGLSIFGTHLEGVLTTQLSTVGVRYTGTNGANIQPGSCSTFGVGVQIGDPTHASYSAIAAAVGGQIGNNNCLGPAKSISGATNASPIVITAIGHGISSGSLVRCVGVGGNAAANGNQENRYLWRVGSVAADTLELLYLNGKNSCGDGAYTSGGTLYEVLGADVQIVNGGARQYQILQLGRSNGEPVIYSQREYLDGVYGEGQDFLHSVVSPKVTGFGGHSGARDYLFARVIAESATNAAMQVKVGGNYQGSYLVGTPSDPERAGLIYDEATKQWLVKLPTGGDVLMQGPLGVSNTGARIYSGTQDPEGNQSAALGSIYLRNTGATTDATVWRKETGGIGNTGWVPISNHPWPSVTGNGGKFLQTDGTVVAWNRVKPSDATQVDVSGFTDGQLVRRNGTALASLATTGDGFLAIASGAPVAAAQKVRLDNSSDVTSSLNQGRVAVIGTSGVLGEITDADLAAQIASEMITELLASATFLNGVDSAIRDNILAYVLANLDYADIATGVKAYLSHSHSYSDVQPASGATTSETKDTGGASW